MGKLIVIEGLDGSGKATQTALLCSFLQSQGIKNCKVSFPDYDSDSSALIKMYLNGDFGASPDAVNAYAASSFYAVDRYASFKRSWKKFYDDDFVIVADRYTTSNMIHQCSKLPEEEWTAFNTWLIEYEYHLLGIPDPALVVYLKSNVSTGQELMNSRYAGDESKKDIHERDIEYLNRCRKAADFCADSYAWITVECIDSSNHIRSIEEIHKEVIEAVRPLIL